MASNPRLATLTLLACLLMILPADAARAPVAAGGDVRATATTVDYYYYTTTPCDGDGKIRLTYHAETNELAWVYTGPCEQSIPTSYYGQGASCTGDYRQRLVCSRNAPAPDSGTERDFSFVLETNGLFTLHLELRYWTEECGYYSCYSYLDLEHTLDLQGKISRLDTKAPDT